IDLPAGIGRAALLPPCGGTPAYLVFQPVGFAVPPPSLGARWALAPPFHPCLCLAAIGGLLSVALSVAPPFPAALLPVRKYGALCCPDFPPSAPEGAKNGGAMRRMSRNGRGRGQWCRISIAVAPWP